MSTPLPATIGRPATSALKALHITTFEGLTTMTEKQLADLHGVGPKAIGILKQSLAEHDLHLLPPEKPSTKR